MQREQFTQQTERHEERQEQRNTPKSVLQLDVEVLEQRIAPITAEHSFWGGVAEYLKY